MKQEIFSVFEKVVGKDNISQDPAILESHTRIRGSILPRTEAVILPGSTEEVQAIVKLCNKHQIKYKAFSTGWCPPAFAHGAHTIQIDLRRMNRIIEINEQNMYAVVEPYVIGAQLQAELMKKGLTFNMTGAGSNCSALPLAAVEGLGHTSQSMSYGERNLLGLEWVTPDGEIIRMGSLGSANEWFCADGPGPSLRGIIRGHVTPLGGLGIFTKAAQKLYHWSGPPSFPVEGISPNYTPQYIPEWFKIRYFSFPSADARFEALRKVSESEIALEVMCFTPSMLAANIATNNPDEIDYYRQITESVQGPGFQIIIAGNSQNDFEYKEQVLDQIVNETDGKSLALMEDTKIGGGQIWRCIRVTSSIRETLRGTGVFSGVLGGFDTLDLMLKYIQQVVPLKTDLINQGLIREDDAVPFGQPIEHGHYGHSEMLIRLNPQVQGSQEALNQLAEAVTQISQNGQFGILNSVLGDKAHNQFGPLASNYHLWQRKIKQSFDPDGMSMGNTYITAENNVGDLN